MIIDDLFCPHVIPYLHLTQRFGRNMLKACCSVAAFPIDDWFLNPTNCWFDLVAPHYLIADYLAKGDGDRPFSDSQNIKYAVKMLAHHA